MSIEENKKEIFISTVCNICGLCKNPDPKFCTMLYYDGDGAQFVREIANRIGKLREISNTTLEILHTFEGFSSLFCRPNRCPLYDKRCEKMLSARVTCYKSFLNQSDTQLGFISLSTIYNRWSGIELAEIGSDIDSIMDVNEKLTKGQRKKLRKAMKKIKKRINGNNIIRSVNNTSFNKNRTIVTYKNRKRNNKKIVETLFFCNPNEEWKEKISKYLEQNEQYENNNRQSSEASKCE